MIFARNQPTSARAPRRTRVPIYEPLESRQLLSATLPAFTETDLVSDGATPAQHTDPNLVNPWGVAITKTGAIWVADNGAGVTTLYDQSGNPSQPVVTIPAPPSAAPGDTSAPTGAVFNTAGKAFLLPNSTTPAEYVFVGEDGTVTAWDPSIGNSAALAVDNSGAGAVYKGVAIAGKGKRARLYAANFHAGTVDVFDSTFKPVTLAAGAFSDSSIPAGFAPFNVQNVGNKLYVTYAMQDADAHDDVKGAGNGFVDVFNASGKMIRRLASGGPLNSPWAVTRLPGVRGGDVAVGNFGDGTINVFTPSGKSLGALNDATTNQPISIDGLWGLTPGVGVAAKNTLFFAAGTNDEADGLFGSLTMQKAAKAKVTNTGSGSGNANGTGTGTGTATGTGTGSGNGTGAGNGFNYGAIAGMPGAGGSSSLTPGMGGAESARTMAGAGSTSASGSTTDVSEPLSGITGMGSINDVTGISRMASIAGPSGISGIPSIAGPTGISGTASINGPTGISGIPSIAEPTGISRMPSIAGPIEISGMPSIVEPTGVSGTVSINGPTGISGIASIAGPSGISGIASIAGPTFIM